MSKEDQIQEIIESWMRLQRPADRSAWQVLGLSHAQVSMLYMLCFHENTSFKQIAKNLDISTSAVTQLVEPLLHKGLVSRQADPKDRRVAKLALTTKGKSLIKKFKRIKTAGLRAALNNLSAKDVAFLTEVSRKMSVNSRGVKTGAS